LKRIYENANLMVLAKPFLYFIICGVLREVPNWTLRKLRLMNEKPATFDVA